MRKICVQSTGAVFADDIEGSYKRIKEAGFDQIDFGLDYYLQSSMINGDHFEDYKEWTSYEYVYNRFKPHFDAVMKAGLEFGQLHAPFPPRVFDDASKDEAMDAIINNSIRLCGEFNCKYIVIHPVTMAFSFTKKEEHDYNIKMYSGYIETAKKYGVTICLENMFIGRNEHMLEGICSDFHEANELIDELNEIANEEIFGFCLDVGHVNLLGRNIKQAIILLDKRLKILHIHDNDGIRDLHTMPFVPNRRPQSYSSDWLGFFRGLAEIKYEGNMDFEIFNLMNCMPRALHMDTLRLMASMGRYMSDKVDDVMEGRPFETDCGFILKR